MLLWKKKYVIMCLVDSSRRDISSIEAMTPPTICLSHLRFAFYPLPGRSVSKPSNIPYHPGLCLNIINKKNRLMDLLQKFCVSSLYCCAVPGNVLCNTFLLDITTRM